MSGLSDREKAIRQRLKDDLLHYAAKCLWIRPKKAEDSDEQGLVRFRLNAVQRKLHERIEAQRARTGRVRILVLKARQPGVSTYVAGRFFWKATHHGGLRVFILTHRDSATNNLFQIAKRFYDHLPALIRPQVKKSNMKELVFGRLDSGYHVGTAKAEGVGRSDTIQCFHGSEVAFWQRAEEHASGALQAVPDADGTEVILESTANGIGGLFHGKCRAAMRGEGEYELVFIPWFEHDEYSKSAPKGWVAPKDFVKYGEVHGLTPDQVFWAYSKNHELAVALNSDPDKICWKFHQEYPATAEEAFQVGDHNSFIKAEPVVAARKAKAADQSHAPLIFGVDSGGDGTDPWSITDRRGRCLGHLLNERFKGGEMEAAAKIGLLIDLHKPDRVFIDVTGGYGAGCLDRLKEQGYDDVVVGVNFGSGARDDRKYANKRAEMFGDLRDWLGDPGGADIIDDDELHGDLCAPGFKINSNDQIVLEPKDKIRQRLSRSTNAGDSAALTFADPVKKKGPKKRRPKRPYNPRKWKGRR